ncbi:MalY/PatB family protein [Gorillibacterium sp. sgz5001074]|uniref:MalY/PatB family protein n=1 Tax=Gorillibacterium sp. sgz5001074 TaxID=3446695 RepID=UPI003F67723C
MTSQFDRIPNRKNTHSYKWDQSEKLFGNPDLLPLWVADMDFESPPAVKAAMERRAAQGIYGYTVMPDEGWNAIIRWYERRHDWTLKKEWLASVTGIVTALSLGVELFSEPGGAVIIQSPVYYPFYDVIKMNGRQVAANPLILKDGRYEMDYGHLEGLMKDGAKLLLLCSPHNPGGRVWEKEELQRLGDLCLKYGVTIVSDEIHADLAFPGHKHIPIASLSEELADITITAIAPTKTFNLPGVPAAYIAASNKELKRKLDHRIKALSLHMTGFFTPDLLTAAYDESEGWLEELMDYLKRNMDYAIGYLAEHLPKVKPMKPDSTYLLWLDCRDLGLDTSGLKELMYRHAGVAFNEGSVYGEEGRGFLRINVACPRATLSAALERFVEAARSL